MEDRGCSEKFKLLSGFRTDRVIGHDARERVGGQLLRKDDGTETVSKVSVGHFCGVLGI